VIRSAISARVKPSGKMILNGFGGRTTGAAWVAGFDVPRSLPIATAAPQPSAASSATRKPSATARRTTTCRLVGPRRPETGACGSISPALR